MNEKNSATYSVIGDTAKQIYDACDVFLGIMEKIKKEDALAAFMVPGPEWSKYPWMVMVGPCPEMCTEATEMALTCVKDTTRHIADDPFAEEDNDDRQ